MAGEWVVGGFEAKGIAYALVFFALGAILRRTFLGRPTRADLDALRARVARAPEEPLPWKLLGVHSARLDLGSRDRLLDEALGLNCAWYADIIMTLTT